MIEHLSYSAISTYQLCPKSFEYHYVKKIKMPSSPSLVFGSAFHGAIEEIVTRRVAGEDINPIMLWNQSWVKAIQQEIDWGGENQEALFNQGLRMLTHPDSLQAINGLKPLIVEGKPTIEKYIELRLPGINVPIIGYIDMIDEAGVPVDFKTSARSWNTAKLQEQTQPLVYIAALTQIGHQFTSGYKFTHYVWVKTKTPQVQMFTSAYSAKQLFFEVQTIQKVWQSIQAGSFAPNTATWKCKPKFCDYFSMCRG